MSLLEDAKSIRKSEIYNDVTSEEIELFVAWVFGDLSNNQVVKVRFPDKKNPQSQMLYRASVVLREAARRGLIVKK